MTHLHSFSPPSKIAVLKGGPSAEREVSFLSGGRVAEALRKAGYQVEEIVVNGPDFVIPPGTDVAFLGLHGTFGEDGQIQRILDERGISYTGSGAEASAIAFDKGLSKDRFVAAGIPTPRSELLSRAEDRQLPIPVVVKPPCQGSSVGIALVRNESEFAPALAEALKFGAPVLVEQLIEGRELTVGVLGDEALPVIEIRPKSGWFDYKNKYTEGLTDEICPAPISEPLTKRAQELAVASHRALGCQVYSRTDLMLDAAGQFHVLEVNTLPGMTATSLLPRAAATAGIPFEKLCETIVLLSCQKPRP
jgi:D-alanine-D-alanine ligase